MNLPSRQLGAALLILIALVSVVITYALVAGLNRSVGALSQAQDQKTHAALAQAKEALIAYAATNNSQPGGLPCPDRNTPGSNNDGTATPVCHPAIGSERIGRLPWKTLGLPDLRDASGERLWYALSGNFVNGGGTAINSDTVGTLNLNGNPPPGSPYTATSLARSIVAIVFAPGAILSGQNRSSANSATVSNYLDLANGDVANDDLFTSGPASSSFNDALLSVTHSDLFTLVESNVASRLSYDVKFYLNNYVTQWGAFPFAVPFTNPSSVENSYIGSVNRTYGLLPIAQDPSLLTWANQITVEETGRATTGTGTIVITGSCTVTNTASPCTTCVSTLSCPIRTTKTGGGTGAGTGYNPLIAVTATLQMVGMALVDRDKTNTYSSVAITAVNVNNTNPVWNSATLRNDGSGHADLRFTNGKLRATATGNNSTRNFTLTFTWSGTAAQYMTRPKGALPAENTDWFFNNQWYKLTYYAISDGYAPGRGKSCVHSGAPLCLTETSPTSTWNDRGAILVLAGRAVTKSDGSVQTRPSPTNSLDDYFEGRNKTTPSDSVYESNTRSSTFNDKVVVLATSP